MHWFVLIPNAGFDTSSKYYLLDIRSLLDQQHHISNSWQIYSLNLRVIERDWIWAASRWLPTWFGLIFTALSRVLSALTGLIMKAHIINTCAFDYTRSLLPFDQFSQGPNASSTQNQNSHQMPVSGAIYVPGFSKWDLIVSLNGWER
jgi:hypothetical protein